MKSLFFIAAFLSVFSLSAQNQATLTVNVSNVQHHEGNVKAVLQDRNNFLTPQFVSCIEVEPTRGNTVQMVFKNIPVGDYSVAIYHDLNANDNFDRNWIGYPKEPYAVTNNLHPLNLLLPSFDAAKIVLTKSGQAVDIRLLNN